MKIKRSTVCSLKFANKAKRDQLALIFEEYARVVNLYIDKFWIECPHKMQLLAPVVNSVDSWFTRRLRQAAAREAIDMVQAAKNRKDIKQTKPVHRGTRMCLSSATALLKENKGTTYDKWLHLYSIGNGIILNIPIKLHKHFYKLAAKGKRLESYVITKDRVQFCFEIETGPKKKPENCIGIDTGINVLASLSTGEQYGTDIKENIERIKRCKQGSLGRKRAVRALHQRMDEVAKQVTTDVDLVVVENLKGITKGTKLKRRLNKNMRRSIGSWHVRYWLSRLEMDCEDKNVSFRIVRPEYTSQTCSACGSVDRRNRNGSVFCCLSCGHQADADVQASQNILSRFLTGLYGAGCKPKTTNLVV